MQVLGAALLEARTAAALGSAGRLVRTGVQCHRGEAGKGCSGPPFSESGVWRARWPAMARPLRAEFPGAVYHVTARGNERRTVFGRDEDRVLWLKTVAEMASDFGVRLHGYCLMGNHFHLIIETPGSNLSAAMGWFQT